jgi:DNA-binding transcriptional LysR family regulator
MNGLLATLPFDLYELSLFQLVAETGSFTRASERAGLTQSAITRQIRGMENQLGVALFERTTRHVALAPAGTLLYEKSRAILKATNELIDGLQHEFHLIPRTLQVGIARSIGLAYLPGFFYAYQRRFPKIHIHVSQGTSKEIQEQLIARELDAGIVSVPERLQRSLEVTHEFADEFTLIAPPGSFPSAPTTARIDVAKRLFAEQRWLLINHDGNTGKSLNTWLNKQDWKIEPAMELDSFDAIVNLVSLGLGCSIVPHRTLPLYATRRVVQRTSLKPRFSRRLGVVVRRDRKRPEHLTGFIENVLF